MPFPTARFSLPHVGGPRGKRSRADARIDTKIRGVFWRSQLADWRVVWRHTTATSSRSQKCSKPSTNTSITGVSLTQCYDDYAALFRALCLDQSYPPFLWGSQIVSRLFSIDALEGRRNPQRIIIQAQSSAKHLAFDSSQMNSC